MNKLTRSIVLSLLALAVTGGVVKIMVNTAPEKKLSDIVAQKKGVRVTEVKLQENSASIEFSGKISAFNKVELFSEVGGVLESDKFRVGNSFKKGEVIFQLNSDEFLNGLKAAKSNLITQVAAAMGDVKIDFPIEAKQWGDFLDQIDVANGLPKLPELKDAKFKRYISGKGVLNSYYTIKSQEEKLNKFSFRAPFDGVLVQANIKKGTLVRGGQPIGLFINPNQYELETEVSLSDLNYVKPGYKMNLHSDDLNLDWTGTVSRINSSIDAKSQMVQVYVAVAGKNLKDGMYLHGESDGMKFENSLSINRKLISNGGIYVLADSTLKHQEIKVLHVSQSTAIISGLKNGDKIVADNMKGLYEGIEVEVLK